MFTGIIEAIGQITHLEKEGTNLHLTIASDLSQEAYIDQSIAHNGVCLTVVSIDTSANTYVVTAIEETLIKTNLGKCIVGSYVNLERAMLAHQRLDGHFVQGHVDGTVECISVIEKDGSWDYRFSLPTEGHGLIVSKGSVCLNGISLTVVDPDENSFGVSIIPYTYEHTCMKYMQAGHSINIEYDMIAKHIVKNIKHYMDAVVGG